MQVAKKLASNLWKALGRRGWERRGGRLLNKALFGEASPRSPVPLNILFLSKGTPFVYLPLKSCTLFMYMLRENKSVRNSGADMCRFGVGLFTFC